MKANPEIRYESGDRLQTRLKVVSPDDKEPFQNWLDIRQEFMERMRWHFGDDTDEYDNPQYGTIHVITEKDGEIVAGMRATPCLDVERSLSWSMLSPTMQDEARSALPQDRNDNIWDITRLVPGHADSESVKTAFLEMFGACLALTQNDRADPPRWFFATTRQMFVFFKRYGIELKEVVRGRIKETDPDDSIFCYANPVDVMRSLEIDKSNIETYRAAERGRIEAASGGEIG